MVKKERSKECFVIELYSCDISNFGKRFHVLRRSCNFRPSGGGFYLICLKENFF